MNPTQLLLIAVSILLVVAIACLAFLLVQKAAQDQLIRDLQAQITTLKGNDSRFRSDAFNYLAIGNSITLHGKGDYWWNEIGMAASVPEKDYFHLVTNYLETKYGEVVAMPFSFNVWETNAHDRTQTINNLRPYLSAELDLITIQLGENVADTRTFVADLKELISCLQQACPKAQILLVDEFWSEDKSALKQLVALDMGIPFAELGDIRGVAEYQCGMGTIVYGDNGQPHTVDHEGVALHPGDKGMEAIANKIIALLEQQ